MEEFYNEFKDRIEGRPDPEFRSEDWEDMESRLDENKPVAIPLFWLWTALPIVLCGLIGWNLYLQQKLSSKVPTTPSAIAVTDTVVIEKVIYKTDTIYKDRITYVARPAEVIEKLVYLKENERGELIRITPEDGVIYSITGNQLMIEDELGDAKTKTMRQSSDYERDAYLEFDPMLDDKQMNSFESLERLPFFIRSVEKNKSNNGKPKRIVHTPFLNSERLVEDRSMMNNAFKPRALSLVLGYGMSNAFGTDLQHRFGYTLTAGAKLRFDPGYRMWVDVGLQNMRFHSSRMGEDIGVPVVTAPSDQFDFENAQVPRKALQYSAGIDYVFLPMNRIRPVVGLGVAGVRYYNTEIIYDFINRDTGDEFIFEKASPDEVLRVNYTIFKIGMEYSLTRRYSLGVNAFYRKGLDDRFGINDFMEGRLNFSARIF